MTTVEFEQDMKHPTLLILPLLTVATLAGCAAPDAPQDDPDEAGSPTGAVGTSRLLPVSSFEPTIGITSSGAIFMTAGNGSIGPGMENLYRSTDDGLTWTDVTAQLAGVSSYPPNSNDPYVYVDKDTDRIFDFEMQGLSCNMLAFSDDDAETWEPRPLGCTPTQVIQDHQTLFSAYPREVEGVTPPLTGYEKVLYYCVNRVADSGCSASFDSGTSWGPFRPAVYTGADPDSIATPSTDNPAAPLEGFCGGLHAHGAAHPDGTIYLPRSWCGVPTVAISEDNALTWTLASMSDTIRMYPTTHEATVGVDDEGNLFGVWLGDDRHVYLAASYDKGYTWSEAIDVTGDQVANPYFPVVTAAGDGNWAIAFIGSQNMNASLDYGEAQHNHTWNAYIAIGYDYGGGIGNGSFEIVRTHDLDDPIARDNCPPGRCQPPGGGGLGDFIDIEIDQYGRPWGAFVDVCHGDCRSGSTGDDADAGNNYALGMVGTLAEGRPLRGDADRLPPLATAGEDPSEV